MAFYADINGRMEVNMANWYLQNGKDSDIVVSSRIRLVRNLNGYKYVNKCSKEEQEEILDKIKEIVPSLG